MKVLIAMEIAGNYPKNILITSFLDENKKFGGWIYMLRNGEIHKLMLGFRGHFETSIEAENYLHDLSKQYVKEYNNKKMQYNNKEYNAAIHDRWRALTVKNPYATQLVTVAYEDGGYTYGEKSIEVRSKNTHYRGDLMICSSINPIIPGMKSGVTLGLVELYDIKLITEFTSDDWACTRIPLERQKQITKGYGWLMRNPRRVIEFPIKGQLGIYNLVYSKGIITEYPRKVVLDKKSYEQMIKDLENG